MKRLRLTQTTHSFRRPRLSMLASAAAALLMIAPLHAQPNNAQDNQPQFSDKDVTSAVEERFTFDNSIPWALVDVKTDQGVVTLTGTVDNLLAKERATKLAEATKGVRSVVNRLQVQTPQRSDAEIRADVENALILDAAADGYEIKPSVQGGVVTLNGTVQSFQEQSLAEHLAKGVRGVKDVKNDITVKFKSSRPDTEIAADAKRALDVDVWVDASKVSVTANSGKISLTGSVGSAAEKSRAQTLAWVSGVTGVDAKGLQVDPTLTRNIRKAGMHVLPDDQIAKAVRDAFIYDPRVWSFNPNVDVKNGVVTLSGVVDNLKARRAAETDARNTYGVQRVRNHLKVRPVNPPSNDQLSQNAKTALQRDVLLDASGINVVAYNGIVTLNGKVDSNYDKARAEDVIERLNGVARV
ncbi:MAG TPA: BON domain-containing protein, partial [Chthoniobacterales bacterium]|nr:BON domain-containing protein [Chthoniobacterales bacterium]